MKLRLPILLLGFASAAHAGFWDDAWLDPALMQAHSLDGGSGFIHVPAPQTLPDGMLTAGIHNYRAALGRGLPYGLEAGGEVELSDWNLSEYSWSSPDNPTFRKENLLYCRWAPLQQGQNSPVGVAVGVEGVGMQDLGFRLHPLSDLAGLERQYVVVGGLLPKLPMFYAAAGYGGGEQPRAPFASLTFAPFAGVACIADYNESQPDVGIRVLLSTQVKLDLDFCKIRSAIPLAMDQREPFDNLLQNNIEFGVSYSEKWP